MRRRPILASLFLFLSALACNFPSNAPVTLTPTDPIFLVTETAALSTFTPIPSFTALPADTAAPLPSATPSFPAASAKDVAVNCRLGPATSWIPLSALNVGQTSQIVGKSRDSGWWYIVDPFNSNRKCWVAASVTNAGGNLASVPVVEPPKAAVTSTALKIDPSSLLLGSCGVTPPVIRFTGTIEVNGPTQVDWYFETQQTGAYSAQKLDFDNFGSKDVTLDFTPTLTAGTYWVRLIITAPNSVQSEAKYTIQCT